MRHFVSELRRRNVLRVAAAYALSAWIIIEAGSVLLPTFGASEGLFRAYVVVVIAGFVVAVVLAWIFELTPEGVKLDRHVDHAASADPRSGQRMNYVIIALLVVALAVSVTFNVMRSGVADPAGPVAQRPSSIAVLPFSSRSSNPENELFADGIHDDLLTRLANVKALKVISRTSVMEYRDTTRSSRDIGEELGVQSILEGTVQRIGDNVRINLRLIDAQTNDPIWADSYDRQLTMQNVFSVQTEIAASVADALQATLSPDERVRIAAVPTSDLRAYRLYKEASRNLYERRVETLRTARQQFQEAIALDPAYAEAHAGLAESILLLWINHQDLPEAEAMTATRESLERALELDPTLADAYAILGLMETHVWSHSRIGTENVDAEAAFRRAIALNPNHASAYMWFAGLRDSEERLDEAIELYQTSLELDPLARIPYSNLAMLYAKAGQHEVAMELFLQAVRIHSEWPTIYQYIATQLWGLGRLDEAYAWHQKAVDVGLGPGRGGNFDIGIMIEFGEIDRARLAIEAYPLEHPYFPMVNAMLALVGGDFDEATRLFGSQIANDQVPRAAALELASDSAILAGNFELARQFVLEATPLLNRDTLARKDRASVKGAVKLAYIEQQEGNTGQAEKLLREALDILRDVPRLGTHGYGIRDVQIYAMLGRKEEAIAAFRDALDEGFRSSIFFNNWPLSEDPFLDSLRDDPRFTAMVDELDAYLAAMRDRLFAAESSGDLGRLMVLAEST